jgi:hypothetical protein
MSVFRKQTTAGKKSPYYHYRTMVEGRLYTGSTKCRRAPETRTFEEDFVKDLRRETSAKAVLIKIHDKVSGGRSIELSDAWGRFLRKPRDRGMTEARRKAAESRWNDFLAFLRDRYPTLKALNEVGPRIAEAYIEHIRTQGRWQRSVTFKRRGDRKEISYKQGLQNLSTAARNDFLQTCKAVFRHLKADAGCVDSPFEHIKALKNQASTRQPFSPEELKKIGEKAEGDMYSLFLTGISTPLWLPSASGCVLAKAVFRPRRAGLHSADPWASATAPKQLRDGLPAHGECLTRLWARGLFLQPPGGLWAACRPSEDRGPPYSACDPHGSRNVGGALSQSLSPVDGRRGESHRRSGPPAGQPVSRRTSPALRPVAASPPARRPGGRSGAGRHARRDPPGEGGGAWGRATLGLRSVCLQCARAL